MTRHVLLDNITHKNLRVIRRHGAEFGDATGSVVTFVTEFIDVQREYPIFFRKDARTGEFIAVALLGFSKDENLFLDGDRWDADYLPGIIARGPFLIGFQERDGQREPVIHVDLEHPRISESEGEPVFLEHGGNSPYLQRIAIVLNGLNSGLAANKPMFDAFQAAGLIEPVNLDIKVGEAEHHQLRGFYTISQEKLRALGPEALHQLHAGGFLNAAFLVLASVSNVEKLIDRRLGRLRAAQSTG
jgi:hypothetical protein